MEDNSNGSRPQEGAAPPPPPTYSGEQNQGYIPPTPENQKNDTLGIVSLVTGIVGLVTMCCYGLGFIPGVVAIICGAMAKSRNQRFAVAGLIMGIIAVVISFVVGILSLIGFIELWDEIMYDLQRY